MATNAQAMLTDVVTFLPGLRYTGKEDMPLLAAIAGTAQVLNDSKTAFKMRWTLPINLRGVVEGTDNPEVMEDQARSLSGRAMHALFTDPVSGEPTNSLEANRFPLDVQNFVMTVGPGRAPHVYEARAGAVVTFETTY